MRLKLALTPAPLLLAALLAGCYAPDPVAVADKYNACGAAPSGIPQCALAGESGFPDETGARRAWELFAAEHVQSAETMACIEAVDCEGDNPAQALQICLDNRLDNVAPGCLSTCGIEYTDCALDLGEDDPVAEQICKDSPGVFGCHETYRTCISGCDRV